MNRLHELTTPAFQKFLFSSVVAVREKGQMTDSQSSDLLLCEAEFILLAKDSFHPRTLEGTCPLWDDGYLRLGCAALKF